MGYGRVFITGGAGFIGSHVVEKFLKEGSEVTILVEYNSNHNIDSLKHLSEEDRKKVKLVFGDVNSYSFLKNKIKDHDLVLHLASLISIPYSYENPAAYFRTNVQGTCNVLQAAMDSNVKRVLHTSTSEVYGTPMSVPINEKFPLQGQSPYSASKIGADKVAESFFCSFGLPVTTIRPFNTYGPRQSMRAVIPSMIMQALYTGKINHGYLEPTRDFTFVKDMAEAFYQIANSTNTYGEVLNVGTGTEVSMREVLKTVLEEAGRPVEVVQDPERMRPSKSEVMRLLADNNKVKELVGWEPKVPFNEGIRKTIEWFKNNKKNNHNLNMYHR